MPSSYAMPSEHSTALAQQQPDQQQQQIKLCSSCRCPLSSDSAATPFLLHDGEDASDTTIVCPPCRTRILALRIEASPVSAARGEVLFAQVERELRRRAAALQTGENEADTLQQLGAINHPQSCPQQPTRDDEDVEMEASVVPLSRSASSSGHSLRPSYAQGSSQGPSSPQASRKSLTVVVNHDAAPHQLETPVSYTAHSPLSRASLARDAPQYAGVHPDPLVDITRLRVRSQGHHCLYPGATFRGTQKSGRNSYDVVVTIVDVDFSCSHLCGYLHISGLTDDWPELTTYFDAEIIGSRYGFLTKKWGASEQEDMVHWARFPAFRHVRHETKKPNLTMKDADRGAVFMRWKEKFVVPNHRVQDINGASFAGFYYVCVDFNPQPVGSAASQAAQAGILPEDIPEASSPLQSSLPKPECSPPRARRESMNRGSRRSARSVSSSRTAPPNVATMSGFYFHQNSEPYQQLSLVHAPDHTSSSFEFR